MVAILKSRKFIFVSFFCLIMVFTGWYLSHIAKNFSSYFISTDDQICASLNLKIVAFIEQIIDQNGILGFKDLKANFPVIEQLKIKRIGLNKNHIQFFSSNLIFRLGSKFVLDANKNVFLANDFSNSSLRGLPIIYQHIAIDSAEDIEAGQRDFAQKLPNFVVQDYEIHWHGLNQIILIDKQNDLRQIVVRHDQAVTRDLLSACYKLFEDYQMHVDKKCLGVIKADLRFDKQIIMAC